MPVKSFEELEEVAVTVWVLAGMDCQLCQSAVAWLIMNRVSDAGGRASIRDICRGVRKEGLLGRRRARADHGPWDFSRPRCRRLLIGVMDVILGQVDDPTGGARLFHRHDISPSWACRLEPAAVIGDYIFYQTASAGREKDPAFSNTDNRRRTTYA